MPKYTQTTQTPWTQSVDQLTQTISTILDAQNQRKKQEKDDKFREDEQKRRLAHERVKFAMEHGTGADYDAAVEYYNSLSPEIQLPKTKPNALQDYESSLQPRTVPAIPAPVVPDASVLGENLDVTAGQDIPARTIPAQAPNLGMKVKALMDTHGWSPERAMNQVKLELEQDKMNQEHQVKQSKLEHEKRIEGLAFDILNKLKSNPRYQMTPNEKGIINLYKSIKTQPSLWGMPGMGAPTTTEDFFPGATPPPVAAPEIAPAGFQAEVPNGKGGFKKVISDGKGGWKDIK